ncbi:hypothetical protein BsWGS_01166 [Bradybaena similaris]
MPRTSDTAVELINVSLVHYGASSEVDTQLGVVTVPKYCWLDLSLTLLRQILKQQLSQVLPERFIFCSRTRHDIQFAQEKDVCAPQICDGNDTILIRSNYDIPRLLVRSSNAIHGHLYIAYVSFLTDLRDLISTNCSGLNGQRKTFSFLYSDGSPVASEAEEETPVHEVLRGCDVYIDVKEHITHESEYSSLLLKRKSQLSMNHARTKTIRLSFSSSKDIERQGSDESASNIQISGSSKPLLISYVRAEAAEHALNLKRKLTDIGFSVYLDVHEIKSGIDWQDSLNYAVSNCEVFIPLVTPRYGETQWTNREVKLADVLGKAILPISFLEEWPPRCLAIQFATTQFVWWKTPEQIAQEFAENKGEDARDIRIWESKYIEMVAREIGKRLKILKSGCTSKPALTRMKTLMKTFAGRLPASATPVLSSQDSEEPTGPHIAICVHPNEVDYGYKLKAWLEELGHSVWLSATKGYSPSLPEADKITPSQEDLSAVMKAEPLSHNSADSSFTVTAEQVAEFQQAVDKAVVIIFVLSKAFTQSKICRQEVYYCEHRKQILPVAYEEFRVPCWLKMLLRTKKLLCAANPCFYKILLMQIKRALDPTAKNCLETDNLEANISLAVQYLKKTLDVKHCVYVCGATKFHDARSEAVCRSIGRHLAKLTTITLVTGGCYGTSEIVGRTYHEEAQRQFQKSIVWHVLPEQDSQVLSDRYNQSSDGTFALKDFGQTLFCGQNLWEKEIIVGRCFQIYLLIEGGQDASHEVEEFVWSDHMVVPVYSAFETGEHAVTDKIFQIVHFLYMQLPPGVSESDWKCLNDRTTPVEEVGQAVANIISDLLEHLHQQLGSPTPMEQLESSTRTPEVFGDSSPKGDPNYALQLDKSYKESVVSLRSMQTYIPPK